MNESIYMIRILKSFIFKHMSFGLKPVSLRNHARSPSYLAPHYTWMLFAHHVRFYSSCTHDVIGTSRASRPLDLLALLHMKLVQDLRGKTQSHMLLEGIDIASPWCSHRSI